MNEDPVARLFHDSRFHANSQQMYGSYNRDLKDFARDEAKKIKELERIRWNEDRLKNKVMRMNDRERAFSKPTFTGART